MDKLSSAREIINNCDKEMAELFQKRMQAVQEVARVKKEKGIPVFDKEREQEVINKNTSLIDDISLRPYYINYLESVMDISKKYQYKILEGAKIAYSGVEGAFAYIASSKIFKSANLVSYPNFKSAYESVEKGECDSVVLPIENSFEGEVGQVSDLMFEGSLYVNGIYDLSVTHNLVGVKGATLNDIKTVISHPQALMQCKDFIQKHNLKTIGSENTALSAKEVFERNDKSIAAISSKECASLYDLDIIEGHINTSYTNTTRFAVFSKVQNENLKSKTPSFILLFTVNDEPGALSKAINIISKFGFNMNVLRSRPIKKTNWQYYFYTQSRGDILGSFGKMMLTELCEYASKVKVVGVFDNEEYLDD